jgi:MFS transporter, DHA1 family, inner membrane transport protein
VPLVAQSACQSRFEYLSGRNFADNDAWSNPTALLLSAAAFLTMLSGLMLGPLLVPLAHEFQTSVAVVGQLLTAMSIAWGITAPLAGPISDTYGRRRMLLTGLLLVMGGLLGAGLAWHYRALLACCLLIGVGGAMVSPNSIATLTEVFPPTGRGKAIGWLLSANGASAVVGVPLVAYLVGTGGWRLPFAVIGTAALGVWILLGVWFPRRQRQPGQALVFWAHYREVGAGGMFWYMLAVNALQQMVFWSMVTYLAAYLLQTYQLPVEATALPLALVGGGVIAGAFLGGRMADQRRRLTRFALACWGSGPLAALVFTAQVSPWATVGLAFGVACLTRMSIAVTPILVLERAGSSRTTATGLFSLSNQLGSVGGPSLGGLMLALGGFPRVGLFCLGVSVLAAVVLQCKVRDSTEFLAQMARQPGTTATE